MLRTSLLYLEVRLDWIQTHFGKWLVAGGSWCSSWFKWRGNSCNFSVTLQMDIQARDVLGFWTRIVWWEWALAHAVQTCPHFWQLHSASTVVFIIYFRCHPWYHCACMSAWSDSCCYSNRTDCTLCHKSVCQKNPILSKDRSGNTAGLVQVIPDNRPLYEPVGLGGSIDEHVKCSHYTSLPSNIKGRVFLAVLLFWTKNIII